MYSILDSCEGWKSNVDDLILGPYDHFSHKNVYPKWKLTDDAYFRICISIFEISIVNLQKRRLKTFLKACTNKIFNTPIECSNLAQVHRTCITAHVIGLPKTWVNGFSCLRKLLADMFATWIHKGVIYRF